MIDSADVNDLQLEDVEDYVADYPDDGSFPQAENLHTPAPPTSPTNYRRGKLISLMRANKWFVGAISVLVLVMLIIVGMLGSATKQAENSNGTGGDSPANQPPIKVDPNKLDPAITGPLLISLENTYERHGLDPAPLKENAGDTPQRKAFYWLASDSNLSNFDHTEKVQRYALATFYYATNQVSTTYAPQPKPWTSAHLWLSRAHACEWKGIVCNSQQHVQAIDLERNNLTGKLPPEIALLYEHLTTIDLTSNLIHLEGDDFGVFELLTNLETLLMDDNFLVSDDGLPWQFKKLGKLQKMRLSYNLLAGELESNQPVLDYLTQLTHLEIESNFLTGTIPQAIASMTNLVYLYMRRNDLSFNLDFLKQGKLTDLFALWLDNNDITGTIPTEIGHMKGLASLSITNATLTGTIPSEIGRITGLRRLWLYSNELTGTIPEAIGNLNQLEVFEVHHNNLGGSMPSGVCASVAGSTYAYKSLTSDCKSQVQCTEKECCTECFD